jgi:hypothetical protein
MLENIDVILESLEKISFDCDEFKEIYEGTTREDNLTSFDKRLIIKPMQIDLNTIYVECQKNKIKSVGFVGRLKISTLDIISEYGELKESYSFYDDMYFYSFEINKGLHKYFISFYEPSHQKLNLSDNHLIENISIEIKA